MASFTRIPVARHVKSGSLVTVDEASAGESCGCVCISCEVPMVARKGPKNRHHFAHQRKTVNQEVHCDISWERCVYWMVEIVLSESLWLQTPDYNLALYQGGLLVTKGQKVAFQQLSCIPPARAFDYQDTFVLTSINQQSKPYHLAITISNDTHLSKFGPYDWTEKLISIAHLSILVDTYQVFVKDREKRFRAMVEAAVLDGIENKCWLYHPNEKAAKQKWECKKEEENRKKAEMERLKHETRFESRQNKLLKNFDKLVCYGHLSVYFCEHCKFLSVPKVDKRRCSRCKQFALKQRWLSPSFRAFLSSTNARTFIEASIANHR